MTKGISGRTQQVRDDLHDRLNQSRGVGQPLPNTDRSFMERRFGVDFRGVRVHTDSNAVRMNRELNAQAFTYGRDIYFGAGRYSSGKRLLAHELTHTVQQDRSKSSDVVQRVVEGSITHMSITEVWAVNLTDAELQEQVNIVRNQLLTMSSGSPEYQAVQLNLRVLEAEVWLRHATLIIDQPVPNVRFNIDVTPAMPTIACRARITGNVSPNPTPQTDFNWRIRVTEQVANDTCASSRIPDCILNVNRNNVRGGAWTPAFPFVQGGNAIISVSTNVRGRLLNTSVNVNIRGLNPGAADITATCGGAGTDADRIACNESGRRQFDAGGMPLLGPGGDVGVMQMCNPAATCLERWHWQKNINKGIELIEQKRNSATTYLNTHVVGGNYPNSLGLNNEAVLQRETLQRYNGGRYWVWVAAKNQWEPNPPNNYVANVLAC